MIKTGHAFKNELTAVKMQKSEWEFKKIKKCFKFFSPLKVPGRPVSIFVFMAASISCLYYYSSFFILTFILFCPQRAPASQGTKPSI